MSSELWARLEPEDDWEPPAIDTTVAHSARMYDHWLGGKTNFPPDRELGDAVERLIPTIRTMARENRTHVTADFDPHAVGAVVDAEGEGRMTLVPRNHAEVARFFGDWELLDPGIVPVMAWRPDDTPPANPQAAYYWAGVARKR